MKGRAAGRNVRAIYRALFRAYGPQHWWPADSPFEVIIGAILTQNTAWGNVEKAIANLKAGRMLSASRLRSLPPGRLARMIRSSGYHTVKARRIRNFLAFLDRRSGGSVARLFRAKPEVVRTELLSVNGIGPETADSILLYAGGAAVFVVDAYTRRIFSRHGLVSGDAGYDEVQRLFLDNLPRDARMFNEYHALIVQVGKANCRKTRPVCRGCPLERFPHATVDRSRSGTSER